MIAHSDPTRLSKAESGARADPLGRSKGLRVASVDRRTGQVRLVPIECVETARARFVVTHPNRDWKDRVSQALDAAMVSAELAGTVALTPVPVPPTPSTPSNVREVSALVDPKMQATMDDAFGQIADYRELREEDQREAAMELGYQLRTPDQRQEPSRER